MVLLMLCVLMPFIDADFSSVLSLLLAAAAMAGLSLPSWIPTKPSSEINYLNHFLPNLSLKISFHGSNHKTHFQTPRFVSPLQASRKISNYRQEPGLVSNTRNWSGGDFEDADEAEEDDGDDDRSLDLLVRFIQNVFRKISRKARNAVRSVLPPSISTKLVAFSVNGVIILAFLWVLKAFLEVVCTLGSLVFVTILVIRGIWSGLAYFRESRNAGHVGGPADEDSIWTGAQPAV